jgi:hypothetical protein
MKPLPSGKLGTIGPNKSKSVSHSKDVKKKVPKKSPAKTVPTKTTFVNDDEELGLQSLTVNKKQPPAEKSPWKTNLVVEKSIIEEKNTENEDDLGLSIGKDLKEGSRPFKPIIEVSKPDCKDEADISKDTAVDEPIGADKEKRINHHLLQVLMMQMRPKNHLLTPKADSFFISYTI